MDAIRRRFEEAVERQVVRYNSVRLSRQKYDEILRNVERIKAGARKTPRDYWLMRHYDVLDVGGCKRLIVPQGSRAPSSDDAEDGAISYYAASDELFDILYETHVSIGHGGRDRMASELSKKYKNVTLADIKKFLDVCVHCHQKKGKEKRATPVVRPILSNELNSRCQVDLIDFQGRPDGEFKYILVYQDNLTKFVQLRPLRSKRAVEVAERLYEIFTIFGAPNIFHSDNGREFCNGVIRSLKTMWPQIKMVHGKPRHSESQGSVERANQDVENIMFTWMQDNCSSNWSKGIYLIQFMKNRAFHSGIKRSPYKALFGTEPKIGLASSKLPKELVGRLETEEELARLVGGDGGGGHDERSDSENVEGDNDPRRDDDGESDATESERDDYYRGSSVRLSPTGSISERAFSLEGALESILPRPSPPASTSRHSPATPIPSTPRHSPPASMPRSSPFGNAPKPSMPRSSPFGNAPKPSTPRSSPTGNAPKRPTPRSLHIGNSPKPSTPRSSPFGNAPKPPTPRSSPIGDSPKATTPKPRESTHSCNFPKATTPKPRESTPPVKSPIPSTSKPRELTPGPSPSSSASSLCSLSIHRLGDEIGDRFELEYVCGDCDRPIDEPSSTRSRGGLCSLCDRERRISGERRGAKSNLEKQADKMQSKNAQYYTNVEVGTTVRLVIPEVDRERGEARSILAVVLRRERRGMFKLGTLDGVLNQRYLRSQFSICREKLLSIDDVPNRELSLRTAAIGQIGRSGKSVKCNCTTKCRDRKCICLRKKRSCTSRCHSSRTCRNK